MNVGVIGAGAWGTALAISSANAKNDVTLWSFNGEIAEFPDISMPKNIKNTQNGRDLCDLDVWLIVTPAIYFRETLCGIRDSFRGQPIIICTKGIEPGTHDFMSEILCRELPECTDFGILSGPQFAAEVARGLPTGSTLAGTKTAIAAGRGALPNLYIQESDDVIGTEICGIGKNAVALATGYYSIRASGENEKALILTRAWGEVVDFGIANNAKIESFLGLCGLGDLFLSATSTTSRNYSGGASIADNKSVSGTVEGISALNGLVFRAKQKNIPMPVLTELQSKISQ